METTNSDRKVVEFERTTNPRWTNPTDEFLAWWEPDRFDRQHGSLGGHQDAMKCYMKDNGEKVWMGIPAKTAWNCECYRQEFYGRNRNKPVEEFAGYGI